LAESHYKKADFSKGIGNMIKGQKNERRKTFEKEG
jgi:hypothetical protein